MAGESQQVPQSKPDPSVMTTEQLDRGLDALREWTLSQLAIRDQRLDGVDKGIDIRLAGIGEILPSVHELMHCERELTDEKFRAVAEKFDDLDTRTAEQKADTKAAVDAALQAAKELVALQTEASDKSIAKSEASTAKQIDALGVIQQNATKSSDEKIDDLKSRMDRIEAQKLGNVEQRTEHRAQSVSVQMLVGSIIGLVTFFIVVGGVIAAVVAASKP